VRTKHLWCFKEIKEIKEISLGNALHVGSKSCLCAFTELTSCLLGPSIAGCNEL